MTEAELASVSNFSVSRPSEGRVEWIGSVDVRGADLDRIVHISRGDISVYSADEADGTKPPEGTKLNRPAVLTFANVFPDAGPGPWSEEDFARLRRKLVKSAKKTDSTFLSYDENLGEWKIQVKHFSRYGICDSDDEDDGDRDNEEREDGSSSTIPADFRPSPANANKRVRLDLPPPAQLRVAADVRAEEGTVMTIEEMQETEGVSSQMGAVVDLFPRALTPEHTAPSVTFADRGEDAANRTAFIDEWFVPLPLFRARRPSLSERLAQQLELHKTSVDMGWINRRSFRVGWLPNGSFLKCDGARVVSARPAHFAFRGTNSQIRLLEIQKRLSQTTQKGPAPAYAFPSVCDAKEEVHASLQSLIGATDSIDEASLSFSLLASYLQAQSESEIVAAARHVLEDALYAEVSQEVGNAANEGNSLLAAVRALESGNTALACRTSAEAGLFELSTLLSSGVKAGKADLSLQMQQVASLGSLASLSPEVRRIAGLFGGDGSRSGDWRRRLAVRLLQQPDEPLSVAIGDIGESSKKSCLLQILRLISGTCGADVAEIVDPTGLGLDPHDFSLSFHVASILSCFQLSSLVASSLPVQEALCDSFASQLESCGLWEWAVFVTLFWIREGGDARGRLYRAKQTRAKELILRHFSTENANASSSRQFLQRIGLPWQWFEEALAYRCAHSGDVEQCVIHLFEADRKWAVQLLETMLLPRVYFFRGEADFRRMAQAFSDLPPDSLIASVSQLFSLEASIANLANMTDADQCRSELSLKQRELQILEDSLLLLSRVQSRAMAHQQVTLLRSTPTVPLAAVLSSCLERLRVQKDRVRALRQLTDPNRIY
jgi:nuclear pore complex protein Nup98-Nup96